MEQDSTLKMTSRYIFVLVLLAILAFGNFFVLRASIETEKSTASIINISGRQRMLLQRSAMFAQRLLVERDRQSRQRLIETVDTMEVSHWALLNGDEALHLPGNPSDEIKEMYFGDPLQVDRQLKRYILEVKAFAASSDMDLTFNNPHLVYIMKASEYDLLLGLSAVVQQYQIASELKIEDISTLQQWLLVISIAILVLSGLFVFRPLVGRVRDEMRNITGAEERTRAIVENMLDGLITFDNVGNIKVFNTAAGVIFGYGADEVVGRNIEELLPGLTDISGSVRTEGLGALQEVMGRRKDGSYMPLELSKNKIELEGEELYVAIMRDISDRKRIEDEILSKNIELGESLTYDRSYGRAMALFSSSYDMIKILEGTLDLLAENHPFPVSAIYLFDEDDQRFVCAATHGAPTSLRTDLDVSDGILGKAASDLKTVIVDGSGANLELRIETGITSIEPAAIMVTPIVFQENLLAMFVLASSRAPTERDRLFIERLSAQLGVALNNLEQYSDLKELSNQLKSKGQEVAQKNIELEQASKLKSEFLANMSHELRTPLNAVIGFSEVLKDGALGDLTSEQREYVVDIMNSGHHLLSLVNDILDLAKIEAGKMTLELEVANIVEILEGCLSIVRESALKNDIKLKLDIADGVEQASVDPRKLKQIIYNLLSNAVKFTSKGGLVSLTANMVGEAGKEYLSIAVSDTGIGIAPEEKELLFQPFVQLDGSKSRKFEGTGLGLTMIKRLTDMHGGMVSVESELGKGSTFTVLLPAWHGLERTIEMDHSDITELGQSSEVELSIITAPELSIPAENCEVASSERSLLLTEQEAKLSALPEAPVVTVDIAAPVITVSPEMPGVVLVATGDVESNLLLEKLLKEAGYNTVSALDGMEAIDIMGRVNPSLVVMDLKAPEMDAISFMAEKARMPSFATIPMLIVSDLSKDGSGGGGMLVGVNAVLRKPIRRSDLVRAVSAVGIGPSAGNGKVRTLIVDDDPVAVRVLGSYLKKDRFEVSTAFGGEEAIKSIIDSSPELVVLDLMMPEVSGLDVLEVMRRDAGDSPVIVLAPKVVNDAERDELIGKAGGDAISGRERFNKEDLIGEVESLLRRSRHGSQQA